VNGQHVLELLTTRQREAGTTLVMVTHDPQIAARADRKIVLRDGEIISDELVDGVGSAEGMMHAR
jgi:putative ABC transport system ATP-binding protein